MCGRALVLPMQELVRHNPRCFALYPKFGSLGPWKHSSLPSLKELGVFLVPNPTPLLGGVFLVGRNDRENRRLVTDEPVEFEKYPVDVQDGRRITDHFRGICRILYPI